MTLRQALPLTLTAIALLTAPDAWPTEDKAASSLNGEGQFNVGLDHLRAGRYDLAIDSFQAAIKEDGKNPYFYKGLGDAYLSKKRYSEAINAFKKALEINPYYVDVRNDLGTAFLLSGKRDEGKKELSAAYANPENPTPEQTAANLGQAYFEEKNYSQALSWYQTSLARNKDYAAAYILTSDALTALGRSDEALSQLEAGAQTLPKDVNIMLALGFAYYRSGRFAEARTRLEQVAAKDPGGAAGRRAVDLLAKFPKQ